MIAHTIYPYVTMGLCVKNSEKTVGEAIRSIMNADYPRDKMEVIIVDDMSRDRTVEVVKTELKGVNLRWVLLYTKGRGLSHARQMVFENAKGKYIIWIDGDGVIPTHFIRRHVEFMERGPNIGASRALRIPKGDTVVARLQGYPWLIHALKKKKEATETRVNKLERLNELAWLGTHGVVCRVEAIKCVGGFDLHIVGAGEDVDLFIRMQREGWKIGETPNTWIYHYMRSDWRSLLKGNVWWGYGRHYLSHKHHKIIGPLITRRTALIFFDIIKLTMKSAKLFKDPACLLMPLYYLTRRIGYLIGFEKAHRNGYGHIMTEDSRPHRSSWAGEGLSQLATHGACPLEDEVPSRARRGV